MKKILISLPFLSLLLLSSSVCMLFSGCKKFEDYNTIIEIVLPEDIYAAGVTVEGRDLYQTISGTEGDVVEIVIDWSDSYLKEQSPRMGVTIVLKQDARYNRNPPIPEIKYDIEASMKPGRIYRWDPKNDTWKNTGKRTDKKEPTIAESSHCFVGTWEGPACGGAKKEIWTFRSNETALQQNPDCSGSCGYGMGEFVWSDDDGSSFYLECTGIEVCGSEGDCSNSATVSYSCNGDKLTLNGTVFTRQ